MKSISLKIDNELLTRINEAFTGKTSQSEKIRELCRVGLNAQNQEVLLQMTSELVNNSKQIRFVGHNFNQLMTIINAQKNIDTQYPQLIEQLTILNDLLGHNQRLIRENLNKIR